MALLKTTAIVPARLSVRGLATSAPGGFLHVLVVVSAAPLLVEFVANLRVGH